MYKIFNASSFLLIFPIISLFVQCSLPLEDQFSKRSDLDEELRQLLPELFSKIGQLEGIMLGLDGLESLKSDISNGKYENEILRQLEKACGLEVKRTTFLITNDFSEKMQKSNLVVSNYFGSYISNTLNADRLNLVGKSNEELCDLLRFIEIERFKKELADIPIPHSTIEQVDYLIYENMIFGLDLATLESAMANWTKNLEILFHVNDDTKKIIKLHGEFWLKYIEVCDQNTKLMEKTFFGGEMPTQNIKAFIGRRNYLISNFFMTKVLI